jgi:hypothetical protein
MFEFFDLPLYIDKMDRFAGYVRACRAGRRSTPAAEFLQEQGGSRVQRHEWDRRNV